MEIGRAVKERNERRGTIADCFWRALGRRSCPVGQQALADEALFFSDGAEAKTCFLVSDRGLYYRHF